MKIGELARRTGLSASRIRFYEASGLIEARRLGNGYRDYPEQVVRSLEIITCGQQAGFSLEEMRTLTQASGAGAARHDLLLASLKRKVAEIEAMQQRLAQNRAQLLAVIAGIERKPQGMDCEANAERLIAGWQAGEDEDVPHSTL
ncbi:MerR family transcriptional regulator [Pseudomonas putida]|uniref:MerR family transcriptional regulator n=1 Tax=Pseudomonas putida TaxID=303 RepID=A0A7W2L690_PSEPU|nr:MULTISPECIES: MerR family transcriptional regulator [Pseudomonas]MBA6119225.1 MerR family transcriptional regulator [Pseudomonas putida]MBI6944601.1 MerR family transcriptional regulator [Pseudomonas putida]MBI6960896.1 MerR family transcriptional regulator [Pseudomonas putida]MCZ9639680.1 MerR family transcriptional regulator [Pseudomonas putida]MEC4878504.1 MerR family transcriptional regulator [Pseudomonas sp. NC26]